MRTRQYRLKRFLSLLILCLLFSACREEILHELDELKANQVQLVLRRKGIESRKKKASGSLWNIEVPSTQVLSSLSELERSRVVLRDLARFKEQNLNLLSSREERRQASAQKLAWSIEQTLERVNGVLEARVHLEIPEDNELTPKNKSGSASVLLVIEESAELEEARLKALIAGAAGIRAESTNLFFSRNRERDSNSEPADKATVSPLSVKGDQPRNYSMPSAYLGSELPYLLLSAFLCLCSGALLFTRRKRKQLALSDLKLIGARQE